VPGVGKCVSMLTVMTEKLSLGTNFTISIQELAFGVLAVSLRGHEAVDRTFSFFQIRCFYHYFLLQFVTSTAGLLFFCGVQHVGCEVEGKNTWSYTTVSHMFLWFDN
jgi:hypothetical protein